MTSSKDEQPSLIEFPLRFPIKVICVAHPDAVESVACIGREVVAHPEHVELATRPSRNGRYVGVTLTVWVTSQEQLDGLYRTLGANEHVHMVL